MQAELLNLSLQARLLLFTLAGFLIILGFRKTGFNLIYKAIGTMLLLPMLYSLMQQLPLWISVSAITLLSIVMLKKIVGNEAWGAFIGGIMYDLFWKIPLKLIKKLLYGVASFFRTRAK